MENLISAAAYPELLDAISFDELLTYLDHSDHVNITSEADLVNNKLIYVRITNDFKPLINPISPDSLAT